MTEPTPPKALTDGSSLPAQRALQAHFLRRIGPPEAQPPDAAECARMAPLWQDWMAREHARCDPAGLPASTDDFLRWYRALYRHNLDRSAAFFEHLAQQCTLDQLGHYIAVESLVDGRFDDVIALAQLGLDDRAKLALARNYWDEMGEGRREHMHTVLFADSAQQLQQLQQQRSGAVPLAGPGVAALRNGNMLLLFALERCYALRLLGAITLLEHTAPHRFSATVRAMRRLGLPESVVHYHELHIRVDARHGDDLLHDVLLPLIGRAPLAMREIAIGMQMRTLIAADYYDSLQTDLQALIRGAA